MILQLKLSQINVADSVQVRAATCPVTVEDYAEALFAGCQLPPIDVFTADQREYWIADGWHRYFAHEKAQRRTILATVHAGGKREALLFGCGANVLHGLRRTNEDKRRAVELVLEDAEWGQWSNRKVAAMCGVSEHLVRVIRSGAGTEAAPEAQEPEVGDPRSEVRGCGGRERIERTCHHLRAAWEVGRGLVDVADELEHQINRAVQIAQSSTEE